MGGGGVLVYTTRLLPVGLTLRMTYGARGNAALLSRYGFATRNNAEPDSSCNNVLEVEIDADGGAARRVAKRSRVIFVRPSREGVGVMSQQEQRPQQSSKG